MSAHTCGSSPAGGVTGKTGKTGTGSAYLLKGLAMSLASAATPSGSDAVGVSWLRPWRRREPVEITGGLVTRRAQRHLPTEEE